MLSPTLSASDKASDPTIGKDLSLYLRLTGHVFAAPLRWTGEDWLHAAGLAAGTAAVGVLDANGLAVADRNQRAAYDRIERVFEAYGNGFTGVGLAGACYVAGYALDNQWLRETGILLASALTVSSATQLSVKYITGRARPYTHLPPSEFRPFSFKSDFTSFPSGHTVVAFTISTVLAERIGNVWASIGLYSAAALGGFSRIYSRKHWLSDLVLGGGLAYFVARSVVSFYEEGLQENNSNGVRIIPHSGGVTVIWRF